MEEHSDRRCETEQIADDELMVLNFSNKRKLCGDFESECPIAAEFDENEASLGAYWTSGGYDYGVDRRCLRSPDLEDVISQLSDGSGRKLSMFGDEFLSTPTIELCGDSEQATLIAERPPPVTPGKKNPALPPAVEVEEFFAAAETHAQKGFAEKYNYDIAKDVPLEGRGGLPPLVRAEVSAEVERITRNIVYPGCPKMWSAGAKSTSLEIRTMQDGGRLSRAKRNMSINIALSPAASFLPFGKAIKISECRKHFTVPPIIGERFCVELAKLFF